MTELDTRVRADNALAWDRSNHLPAGHRLYTSPVALKWRADNNNYSSRGKPCSWPTMPGDWLTSKSLPRTVSSGEPATDAQYWLGSGYAPANDNKRPVVRRENDGPDADYRARQANPGTSRGYEGDILSRLVAAGEHESAFVLRQIGALLSPSGLLAANDNFAEDAEPEMGDGFGLDYAMEEDKAEDVIEAYAVTGTLPNGRFAFRQRSGAGGCKLTASHRRQEKEGLHVDRYIALRGVASLPTQQYHSDGESPWWRSHAPKNARAAAELVEACERTDFRRVTWTRYAALPARVYGALGIYSEVKGTGECKATAPAHDAIHEIYRRAAEQEFRSRLPSHHLRIIETTLARGGYTAIGQAEGLSRNGAKKAVLAALREAWAVLTGITEEKMPEEKKMAA